MKEKRTAPRVRERFPVKITTAGKTFRGESHDVSMNGLACSSPLPLPVSTPVTIHLILPPAERSHSSGETACRGKVVRVEGQSSRENHGGYRLALNFLELPIRSRRRLEKFIGRRLKTDDLSAPEILTRLDSIFQQGATCRSSSFIPPFHEVEINIFFAGEADDSPGISCSGVVVDCEEDEEGIGYLVDLFFLDLKSEDRRTMSSYLKV